MRTLIRRLEERRSAGLDADAHEAIWALGARMARETRRAFDLDGAFLEATRKHPKVFPGAPYHEDDPEFEEVFGAFRDGAKSAGFRESVEEAATQWAHLEKRLRAVDWADAKAVDLFWIKDAQIAAAIEEDPERTVKLWNRYAGEDAQATIEDEE